MTENTNPQTPATGGSPVPPTPNQGPPGAPFSPGAAPIPAVPPGTTAPTAPPVTSATTQFPVGAFDQPGWQPPNPSEQEPVGGWQQAYHKAKTRSQVFMATTALAGVLAVALGAWGIAQAVTSDSGSRLASQSGTFSGPGGGPGGGQLGGGQLGGGRGMADGDGGGLGGGMGPGGGLAQDGTGRGPLGQLLNSDGSLNQSAVDEFKAHLTQDPQDATFLSQMLSRAVTAGALTQAQADKLIAALGINAATPAPTTTPTPTASASKAAASA